MTKPLEILALDFETASHCDIRRGSAAYAEHETTRALCAVFKFVEFVNPRHTRLPRVQCDTYHWREGETVDQRVIKWIREGRPMMAHNVSFEHEILRAGHLPKVPAPAVKQWHDTMAMAAALNLPQSLDGLTQALGVTAKKDLEGYRLMMRMCKLNADGTHQHKVTRHDFDRLLEYCDADVDAMVAAYAAMPPMLESEREVWEADARMNARGAFIDTEFTNSIAVLAELREGELNAAAQSTSAMLMMKAVDRQLMELCTACGLDLPQRRRGNGSVTASLDAAACDELLERNDIPPAIRALLIGRREAGRLTSLAKLKALPQIRSKDDRVRWQVRFCGASQTGRWAAKGLQLHNTPKDRRKKEHTDLVRRAIERRDYKLLTGVEANVLEALSLCLRSMVVAPPGMELIAADYSAIEARVLPWLCFFEPKLQLFRDGVDTYVRAAKNVGSDNRSLGKVQELGLGFGMGVPKFAETADAWGVPLDLKEARRVQKLWREDNKPIQEFWRDLDFTAKELIEGPARRSAPVGRCIMRRTTDRLIIELPSGRYLNYWQPRIDKQVRKFDYVTEDGELKSDEAEVDVIRFYGPGKSGRMDLKDTYGGKLCENVTQATARDILAGALVRVASSTTYTPVLHMHDSLAAEVRAGTGSVEEFEHLMTEPLPWAHGLPIDAEGYRARYYQG